MRRPQRPGGSIDDGHDGGRHHHGLGPAPPQEIRPEAVVDQPQHGKRTGLHHRHRMQQGGDRRGRHRGVRQPAVEGEDGRLHAEAEEGRHKGQPQRLFVSGRQALVQDPPVLKVQMTHPVVEQKDHADEGKGGTGDGIYQVFAAGIAGLFIHGVHHQRQRRQRPRLVEKVERQEVLRIGDPQHHAVGHQPEGEEAVLVPLVGHVIQRIRRHQRPQDRYDAAVDDGRTVDPQGDGKHLAEAHQDTGQKIAVMQIGQDDTGQRQCRRHQGRCHDVAAAHLAALRLQDQQPDPQQHGQQNGQR